MRRALLGSTIAAGFVSAAIGVTAQKTNHLITPDNVARLTVAWTYDTRESTDPLPGRSKRPALEATPVYADGHLYFATPRGAVIALDAESGAEAWRVELNVRQDANYSEFTSRGVTLHRSRLYVGTVDARLVCLERDRGRRCAGFGRDGQIDLTSGLRRRPEYPGEYGVSTPPAIYRGLVIVGSFVADNSRARMASGEVRAYDAQTGALRWTFHPLPADAEAGGANTWSKIIVDEANGLVFLPIGSASPDYFGGLRPGQDGYANSVVALRGDTGEIAWHFQTVHHDLWDYDVASPPVLYQAKAGPAIAVGSKTGHLFLLDRLTGKPLFSIAERPVPRSDVNGEHAFATQPFPERPPALVPQRVGDADVWGETPEERAACRETLKTLRNEGIFTPPSVGGTLAIPGNIGGLHWGAPVWDGPRRLLVVPVNNLPAIVRLIPASRFDELRRAHPERETTEQSGTPYAMSRQFFLSPKGRPCVAPPWGELVAVDVDRGSIAWRSTLGDMRERMAIGFPSPTGAPNLGGPIVTTSGLVFIGAAVDPFLRAFDAKDGQELWKGRLPTSARATPAIFTSPAGREMVVIAAGGHDTPLSRLDTKIVAFALER